MPRVPLSVTFAALVRQSCRVSLQQTSLAERKEPLVPKHHVIKHADAEQVACFFQAACYLDVFWAWCRITARVIMHENHGGSAKVRRCPPYFAWMHERRGKASSRDDLETVHAIFVVHAEQGKMLFVRIQCLIDRTCKLLNVSDDLHGEPLGNSAGSATNCTRKVLSRYAIVASPRARRDGRKADAL